MVSIACQRNSNLPYCETTKKETFYDAVTTIPSSAPLRYPQNRRRPPLMPTALLYGPNPTVVYKLYPSLLPDNNPEWYCNQSQPLFRSTCVPWKKLRFDLKKYADTCSVPNGNEYPSEDDGRPYGHGQKQTDGAIGVGSSFALGLGPVAGFEVVGSQGIDVGPVPLLDKIGGFVMNKGTELGILGERIGPGPARTMSGLLRAYPTLDPNSPLNQRAVAELQQNFFRSLGLGSLPGLGKLFDKSSPNTSHKPKIRGYEPGYGAVNKNVSIATGKTDTDAVVLPTLIGELELNKGIGLGIG